MRRIVLYDVARLLNRARAATPTGIDRVDLRYLEHFLNTPETRVVGVVQKRDRLVAVPDRDLDRLWQLLKDRWIEGGPASPKMKRLQRALRRRSVLRSFRSRFWGAAHLDPKLQTLRGEPVVYVNCSHNGIRSRAIFDTLRGQLDAHLIFYVHDTIPIDFPQFVRTGFDARHRQRMDIVGHCADLVLTNSGYSRDRFSAFCETRQITPPPIQVLHIGLEPGFAERAAALPSANAAAPYFVAVGTIEPRKNLSLLLKTWQRLQAAGGPVPELRLIGRRGWVTDENRDFDELLATVRDHVAEMGAVGDAELLAQVRGARAMLFPSFVEGWGMPLVESQALGTPVIASDIAAFREASQGLAELLPTDDPVAWETAVRRHAEAPPEAARARLAGFRPPSWNDHFTALERLLISTKPAEDASAEPRYAHG